MSDKLKKFFEEELKSQVDSCKILFQKAERAERVGNLEDAILYLESALLVKPDDSSLQERLNQLTKQLELKSEPYIPPFTLIKDDEPVENIKVTWEHFSWTVELEPPSVYTLLDNSGRVAKRIDLSGFQTTLPALPGTLYSSFQRQIEEVPIASPDGSKKSQMIVKLAAKQDQLILSVEVKKT